MKSSFVLMGALVPLVFVNGDYSDDEESVPEYYYDEDAVDLYNNNGNIQVQTGSCFCDTGCYANEWLTLKCCDEICFAAEQKGTESECERNCPWYNAIVKHKERWQKCETEEKEQHVAEGDEEHRERGTNAKRALTGEARFHRNREAFLSPERPTEIDDHANQTNDANDLRIKDLAQKLENAQSAIDVMFKVWIPCAAIVPLFLVSLGFAFLMKWKTGKMYNTGGQSVGSLIIVKDQGRSQMSLRSQTPSQV